MMSENMIQTAAAKSCELYAAHLMQDYEDTFSHEFTSKFEAKIKKLQRKEDHPQMYFFLQRVASIAIAILLAGSIWLTVDTEARATFFGWVRNVYGTYFVLRHNETTGEKQNSTVYRPTWIPDGYREFKVITSEERVLVAFSNEAGEMLKFSYIQSPTEIDWFFDTTNTERKQAMVHQSVADVFVSCDPEVASTIIWTTTDQSAFYISGFLESEELIRIAESVEEIDM